MAHKVFATISQFGKNLQIHGLQLIKSAAWHNNPKPLCLMFPIYQCPRGKWRINKHHIVIYMFFLAAVKSLRWFMMQTSADNVKACIVCQTVCGHRSSICFFKQYMQILFSGISHPKQEASCQHVTWCDGGFFLSKQALHLNQLPLTHTQPKIWRERTCLKCKQKLLWLLSCPSRLTF